MLRRTRLAGAAALACCGALAAPAAGQAAEALYGVTDDNRLVVFSSQSPGDVAGGVAISGLQSGENIVGIDVRPANDVLYGVGSTSRIYQINPTTGATRLAGTLTPGLNGTAFGVDFNPVADALRIVSDADQNLRQRFSDQQTFADTPLQYAAGDPGAGSNPTVTGAAYTNSVPGATTTVLYDIDTARDTLVRQDPPNAGTLNTVGPLGFDISEAGGFDIASDGVAYASVVRAGQERSELVRIDLTNGRATPVSADANIDAVSGTAVRPLRALAAAGRVPDDGAAPRISVAFSSTILEQNTNTLRPTVACDESCTATVAATVAGRAAGTGTAELVGGAGRVSVEVPLNGTARARIARAGTELIRLTITVRDAAGNTTTQRRISRTQTLAARRAG